MNRKLFALVGLLSMAGATAAVFIASSSIEKVDPINHDLRRDKNTTTQVGLFPEKQMGAKYPGNTFYFADYTDSQWYITGDRNVWVRFVTSDNKVADINMGKQASFQDESLKNIVKCIVPAIPGDSNQSTWNRALVVRVDAKLDYIPFDNSNLYSNNTGDQSFTANQDCIYCNYDGGYGIKTLGANEPLRVLAWAKEWSKPYFNGANNFCSYSSDLNAEKLSQLEADWAASGELFNALTPEIKYAFSTQPASADPDSYGQPTIGGIAARYDFIWGKYSSGYGITLTNWADRTIL